MIEQKWQVKVENRPKFEKAIKKWHNLATIIGWKDLTEMYVEQTAPFQTEPKLRGSREQKLKQAKTILLRTMGDELVGISHFPYKNEGDHTAEERFTEHRLVDQGKFLLHGHVHTFWKQKGKQINVGVDVWDWKPVSEAQILQLIRGEADVTP